MYYASARRILRVQHVCASTFIPRRRGAKKRATFDVADSPCFSDKAEIQRRRKGDRRNRRQKRRRTGIQLEFHNPFSCAKKYKREGKEYDTRLPTLSHSCRAVEAVFRCEMGSAVTISIAKCQKFGRRTIQKDWQLISCLFFII